MVFYYDAIVGLRYYTLEPIFELDLSAIPEAPIEFLKEYLFKTGISLVNPVKVITPPILSNY